MSWLVAASFSLANNLISADVLPAAQERYKNTFSKVSFNVGCNKNRLETEKKISARKISCKKPKTTIKNLRVGDLNLGMVGNRKHTYFFVWPNDDDDNDSDSDNNINNNKNNSNNNNNNNNTTLLTEGDT